MSTCYQCGKKIENGDGVRKEVYVGHSSSIGFWGKRIGSSNRNNYSMRLFCNDCARPNFIQLLLGSAIGILKVILILALLWEFRSCIL